jgi:hypothetical protein
MSFHNGTSILVQGGRMGSWGYVVSQFVPSHVPSRYMGQAMSGASHTKIKMWEAGARNRPKNAVQRTCGEAADGTHYNSVFFSTFRHTRGHTR